MLDMEDQVFDRRIERFDGERHDREGFSCGVESLDGYFCAHARQDVKKYAAALFVMVEGSNVIGYYTLSSYAIKPGDLPSTVSRKLPRYPNLPATLLGRLAVDSRYQGQGCGEALLTDALNRSLNHTSEIGSVAVVVEAENPRAIAFYRAYGFIQFPEHENKLFLPMRTIRQTFKKAVVT